jgi:hypothetical protein
VADPARRGEPIGERRRRLGEAGLKLAPGSGVKCPDKAKPGPCENGHVETVLWRDVPVGMPGQHAFTGKRVRTRFSRGRQLKRSDAAQRNAAIAMNGRFAAIAFEEHNPVHDAIWVATSADGGRRWSHPAHADTKGPFFADLRWPAVAVSASGVVTVAWTASSPDGSAPSRIAWSRAQVHAGTFPLFSDARVLDPGAPADAAQWKPALAQGAGGVVHAAFVDTRARSKDASLPQAGVYYTRIAADGSVAAPKRMDAGPPDALAVKLDNAWAPKLAVRGKSVLLTWIDFMHYDWDVLSRLSGDGGETFAAQVDSNLEKADVEDLSDSPQPLFVRGAPLIAWTDFHKRDAIAAAHPLYDTYVAAPGKPPVQADPYGARQASTFWPAACADGRDALVAFQDSATGVGRIRITRMRKASKRGRALPVNDSHANAYRPALACTRGRAVVAWEDARNGPPHIFVATARTRTLE